MKTKLLGFVLGIGLSLSTQAQVIDLTTGVGSIGSPDPYWMVEPPSGGGFGPITISTGVLEDPTGNLYPNAYKHDDCGQWISPYLNSSYNIIRTGVEAGDFNYRREFVLDSCISTVAMLNLSFMAADNELTEVYVNGTLYAPPPGITHTTPGSMLAVPVIVAPGLNTVNVIVDNWNSYTGLQLCGDITVINQQTAPANLGCCLVDAGQVLSWTAVPDAIGYEVEITWNDPLCCGDAGEVSVETINTVGNSIVIPTGGGCFSWRVKTIYAECESVFSKLHCSCGDYCVPPVDYNCNVYISGERQLGWNAVPSALGYEVEVSWNDPSCCGSAGFPSGNIYGTGTNTLYIGDATTCFAWRVRTVCEDQSYSEWGPWQCSCPTSTGGGSSKASSGESSSMDGVMFQSVLVLPNPANESVEFQLKSVESHVETGELTLTDVNQRVVHSGTVRLNGSTKVNVQNLPSGMYFYTIEGDDAKTAVGKFMVQH